MEDLSVLRQQLDEIDAQIVALYEKRMAVCSKVADFKVEAGRKVLDRERELQKLESLSALVESDFDKHAVKELFSQLMAMSRKLQYIKLADRGVAGNLPFVPIDAIDKVHCRVAYQGVFGAYSQQATQMFFGKDVNSFHMDTWRECMEAIKEGIADYAVLPIENTSAGEVNDIYDLLEEYDNYIVGEQIVKVDHALLALPGASMDDIKTVYSHPQGLMQCSVFLDQHKEWEQKSVANTAVAAKKVLDDGDVTKAAIASTVAAEHFGLQILQHPINHNKFNSTRFIIVTNRKMYEKGATKVSLCFELPHTSGALFNILSHIIYNDLNMCKIESRPIPGRNWEYHFFVDFYGNLDDSAVKNAIRGIMAESVNCKILGNY